MGPKKRAVFAKSLTSESTRPAACVECLEGAFHHMYYRGKIFLSIPCPFGRILIF